MVWKIPLVIDLSMLCVFVIRAQSNKISQTLTFDNSRIKYKHNSMILPLKALSQGTPILALILWFLTTT